MNSLPMMSRIVLFTALSFCLFQCKPASNSSQKSFKDISIEAAHEKLATSKSIFVDVRTPEEIAEGKIKGAIELDYRSSDFEDKILKLDRDKDYVIYCRSGGRSKRFAEVMQKHEFKQVSNMLGGYEAWKSKYSSK